MDEAEKKEWTRLWAGKLAYGSFPRGNIVKVGPGKRVKQTGLRRIWVDRWFLLTPPFLVYFKSESSNCPCEGIVFVKNCQVEPSSGFLGQPHCVTLHLAAPRKPSKGPEDNCFLFAAPDVGTLSEWVAAFATPARPQRLLPASTSGSPTLPKTDSSRPPRLAPIAPCTPPNPPASNGHPCSSSTDEVTGAAPLLQPFACAGLEAAWSVAAARGDFYSKPESLPRELVPPTPLPRGMSCAEAFRVLFSDLSDCTLALHEQLKDTALEMPPWPSEAGRNGPPHWLGWRQLAWEGPAAGTGSPTKASTKVRQQQQQSYVFLEDPATRLRSLYVCMSSAPVEHAEQYRAEYVVQVQQGPAEEGTPCQATYRVMGGVVPLKNFLMKHKVLANAMKDLEEVVLTFQRLAQQQGAQWAQAHAGRAEALDAARGPNHRREGALPATVDSRSPQKRPSRTPDPQSPASTTAAGFHAFPNWATACFQPPPGADPKVERATTPAALAVPARDPTARADLRRSRAAERVLERLLWEGLALDPGNADLQVAGLRSINQFLLPHRQVGSLNPEVLDNLYTIMAAHPDRPNVQDAALSLLYSLCTKTSNVPIVEAHARLVEAVTLALRTHAATLPTLRSYAQAFEFLSADFRQALAAVPGFPVLQYYGVPCQEAMGSDIPSNPATPALALGSAVGAGGATTPPPDGVPRPAHKREWLQRTFDIQDEVVEEFVCHIQDPLPRQGTLYLCHRHLCFSSPFPPRLLLPFAEVTSVERRSTARMFPTAIEVKVGDRVYFFGGFLKRDKAYDIIHQVFVVFKAQQDASSPTKPKALTEAADQKPAGEGKADGRASGTSPAPAVAEAPSSALRVVKVESFDSDDSD